MFDNNEVAIVETVRDETMEKMIEYIRSREDFKEQGWLTKDEISMAVKAYRMMKNDVDIQQFVNVFNSIKGAK